STATPYSWSTYVVLDAAALVPGGTYVFSLSGTDKFKAVGKATITVIANQAPSPGVFEVTPTNGVALETLFTFTGSLWSDDVDDYPLSYRFMYVVGDYTSDSQPVVIRGSSMSPSTTGILPVGNDANRQVSTLLYVSDRLGATAVAISTVTVQPVQKAAAELTAFLSTQATNLLGDAESNQNPELLVSLASTLTSVLNSATGEETGTQAEVEAATEARAELRVTLVGALAAAAASLEKTSENLDSQ
ncbi:REJ domain-containing protein, partial [Tribonema minus]